MLEYFRQILFLKPQAFVLPTESAEQLFLILFLVLLASLSEALGQSVVLFVNRVKARRFLAALLSSSLIYFFNYLFWVFGIALVLRWLLPPEIHKGYPVYYIVALAYLPRLFAFLVFTPLLGSAINMLLRIWGMLILFRALVLIQHLGEAEALTIVIIGFLVTVIIKHSFGHPLIAWARALTKRTAGADLRLSPDALAEELDSELKAIEKRRSKDGS